jgi:hypothetical protein
VAPAVFPDNTVLINFGTVSRLDLLRDWLRGRGRWTQAVSDEAAASASHVQALLGLVEKGWLGSPIEIDQPAAIREVERLRRSVFGGAMSRPRQHLGESQTCYLLKFETAWSGSWWISDDVDSVEWARFQGITVRTTLDVIRELVADGDLTAAHGYRLLEQMVEAGRFNVAMPKRAEDLRRR